MRAWIERYRGHFDQGWDVWRQQTLGRQQASGLLPAHARLSPRPDWVPAWDSLSADERRVYARYVRGGTPSHAEHKTLEDFLFRYIAREAGRLHMAVHIHSFEGAGGFYRAAGSDPLLLESAFNDSTLRGTSFVIVHGGGMYSTHAGAMLWKPNVYLDISAVSLVYSPTTLAAAVRPLLEQYPEKVLFGTDAFTAGPDAGWELAAWLGTTTARQSLGIALSGMMRDGLIDRSRAEQIATLVLRGNAIRLYHLTSP